MLSFYAVKSINRCLGLPSLGLASPFRKRVERKLFYSLRSTFEEKILPLYSIGDTGVKVYSVVEIRSPSSFA